MLILKTHESNSDYLKFMNKEELIQKTKEDILEEIKAKEVKIEFISGIPFKKIIMAMTAWPEIYQGWEAVEGTIPILPKTIETEDKQFQWIWDGVLFDDQQARLLIGSAWFDIFKRMIKGYFVYPDGTYNTSCTNLLTLLKKEK